MKSKKEWETKSLEGIHKVRAEIDKEIQQKGISPSQWIKRKGTVDVETLCQSLGLDKIKVAKRGRVITLS